jgi:hypothetical protein
MTTGTYEGFELLGLRKPHEKMRGEKDPPGLGSLFSHEDGLIWRQNGTGRVAEMSTSIVIETTDSISEFSDSHYEKSDFSLTWSCDRRRSRMPPIPFSVLNCFACDLRYLIDSNASYVTRSNLHPTSGLAPRLPPCAACGLPAPNWRGPHASICTAPNLRSARRP